MKWIEHVTRLRQMRNAGTSFWKLQGWKSYGRPRCRREDKIRTNLQETKFEVFEWIEMTQNCTGFCEEVNDTKGSLKANNFFTGCVTLNFVMNTLNHEVG